MNVDLRIFSDDKKTLKAVKEKQKTTYAMLIKSILTYYSSLPVEELAEIILEQHQKRAVRKETVTIKESMINNESNHLRKVYNAILTKIPRLEFKEMLCILIHHFIETKPLD